MKAHCDRHLTYRTNCGECVNLEHFNMESPLLKYFDEEKKPMEKKSKLEQRIETLEKRVAVQDKLIKSYQEEVEIQAPQKVFLSRMTFRSGRFPWTKATQDHWVDSAGTVLRIDTMPSPYIKNCLHALCDRYGKGWELHICVPEMIRVLVERGDI